MIFIKKKYFKLLKNKNSKKEFFQDFFLIWRSARIFVALILLFEIRLLAGTPDQRIVSTSLASDEIVYALLAKGGFLSRLIGISYLAKDPQYSNIDSVSYMIANFVGQEAESIIKLKPTHVILSRFNRPDLETVLKASGVKILMLSEFNHLTDIWENIIRIGDFLGLGSLARDFVASQNQQLQTLQIGCSAYRVKNPKKNALIMPGPQSELPGGNTLVNDVIEAAGLGNYLASLGHKGWVKLTDEFFLVAQPDYVVVLDGPKPFQLHDFFHTPGLKPLARIPRLHVPGKELMATSHYVIKAIEKIMNQRCPGSPRPKL